MGRTAHWRVVGERTNERTTPPPLTMREGVVILTLLVFNPPRGRDGHDRPGRALRRAIMVGPPAALPREAGASRRRTVGVECRETTQCLD